VAGPGRRPSSIRRGPARPRKASSSCAGGWSPTCPHPAELLAAIPPEIVGHVCLAGDQQTVRARLAEYASAGVDEIALVPGSSEADGYLKTGDILAIAGDDLQYLHYVDRSKDMVVRGGMKISAAELESGRARP